MPTIKIDDKDYDFDTLSQEAKDQLTSLQFVDNELIRLNAQVAVYSTARNGYSAALKELLPKNLS
jgi:Family of unknown function (DUF6447)